MKKLGKIDGKTLKGFVEWLREQDCGCCHIPVDDTETQTISICVGWLKVSVDIGPEKPLKIGKCTVYTREKRDEWRIYAKIGMQSFNNCMQCDFDIDFEMPYDNETGEVYDTLTEVDCRTMKEYNALAAWLNKEARNALMFQKEQEKKQAA